MLNWNIQRGLDETEIKDVLTTAIEGGIGYWACLGNDDEEWIKARTEYKEAHKETPCYCDIAYDVMFKNHKAVIFYNEQDDDKPLYLTKDKFRDGCRLFEESRGKSIHQMLDDVEFDAEDADCIIQFALFREVIYG